ncbi:MAG: hypothetical protein ACI4P4_07795 [Faecousia sp.]
MARYVSLIYTDDCPLGGVEGENFREFLRLYFERSNFFSLTVFSKRHPVVKRLAPFREQTTVVKKWFGYTQGMYEPLTESIFRAEPQAMEVLLEFFDNVYLSPQNTISDLSFFAEDRMILGTLSHEYICHAEVLDAQLEEALNRIGNWEPLPDEFQSGLRKIRLSEIPQYASMPLLRH